MVALQIIKTKNAIADTDLLYAGDGVQPRPGLGVNLSPIGYTMNQWVFRNYLMHAREWRPVRTGDDWKTFMVVSSFPTNWSSDGYPIEFVSKSGSRGLGYQTEIGTSSLYPVGNYFLTFEGTGNFSLLGDATDVKKVSSNRFEFSVTRPTTTGIIVVITEPNITKAFLSERREEFNDCTFSSDFINAIKVFQGLRFSSWMVNRVGDFAYLPNANKEWSDRRPPTYYTQSSQVMVSIELIIELANLMEKDIWLSIPSISSADYIYQLAFYVKNNIKDNIGTIYVEQSSDRGWGQNNRNLTMQLIHIWKDVFGANNSRIKYVLSTNIPAYFESVVSLYSKQDLQEFDAFSVGGYIAYDLDMNYEGYDVRKTLNYTSDTINQLIRQEIYKDEISLIHLLHKVQITFRKPLIGFNVGFRVHAPGYSNRWKKTNDSAIELRLEDLIIDALRQPMVEDLYLDFFERWYKSGASIMFLSSLVDKVDRCPNGGGRCGYFSLLETLTQNITQVPKYRAAISWINGAKGKLPFVSSDIPKKEKKQCFGCKWGTCFDGTCHCFNGFSGTNCDQQTKKYLDCASNSTKFGVNPYGLSDWSTELTFVDIHRRARKWINQKIVFRNVWGELDQEAISLDEKYGYPQFLNVGQSVGTFATRDVAAHFPGMFYKKVVIFK